MFSTPEKYSRLQSTRAKIKQMNNPVASCNWLHMGYYKQARLISEGYLQNELINPALMEKIIISREGHGSQHITGCELPLYDCRLLEAAKR